MRRLLSQLGQALTDALEGPDRLIERHDERNLRIRCALKDHALIHVVSHPVRGERGTAALSFTCAHCGEDCAEFFRVDIDRDTLDKHECVSSAVLFTNKTGRTLSIVVNDQVHELLPEHDAEFAEIRRFPLRPEE